jgi:hypothetical protein
MRERFGDKGSILELVSEFLLDRGEKHSNLAFSDKNSYFLTQMPWSCPTERKSEGFTYLKSSPDATTEVSRTQRRLRAIGKTLESI